MPTIQFEENGRFVTINNVRNFRYQTTEDYVEQWELRRYDLDGIRSVDFMLEILPAVPGMAHTLLTFGFEDGEHVGISVEVRKEEGEIFSPIAGLFRRYELMYLIGDERDLIGLRANIREDRVFLYPLRGEPQQVKELFVAMLKRAEKLRREPEFYNTITSTCTTNLVSHFEQLRREPLDFELRILLPADSDELAWELGLIDFDGTLEEAQRRFLINGRTKMLDDGKAWSRQIRQATKE